MKEQAIKQMLSMLPDKVEGFDGSEYHLPIKTTFLGDNDINLDSLREQLAENMNSDVKQAVEPILLAAEVYEASMKDKEEFFVTDRMLQSYVFTGSKFSPGWVLILGGNGQAQLISKLRQRKFIVFTDQPGIDDTFFIGSRETSPIYFLQMMVRYGLIWGRIAPGDDHKMGHYLEKDMPGFIIINEDLNPLKYVITLGLMKLGAPAVVPSTYPFPYGNRIVADEIEDMVTKGVQFANLRVKYLNKEKISLPEFCNTAFSNKKIEDPDIYGGTPNSFFSVMPGQNINKSINVIGKLIDEIGIAVTIEHENLSDDLILMIQKTALKAINYLDGVKALEKEGVLFIQTEKGRSLDNNQIGEAIYWGIRLKYPRLTRIAIDIIYDKELLKQKAPKAKEYKEHCKNVIDNMREDNTEEFCACIDCRPFSLEHTCILTPERVAMCAERTYLMVKADAYLGYMSYIFQRSTERDLPSRLIFNKGAVLNNETGEYEGCNQAYQYMTKGTLQRVFLHSLRGYPHTSCGCFQNLAFWIEEVKGIAIMSRNSKAIAPNGLTWPVLANHAGGKQSDGITGVSISYIRSKKFLKGDGGIGNVVWVDSELYPKIAGTFLPGQKVATEKDVTSLEELKSFLNRA